VTEVRPNLLTIDELAAAAGTTTRRVRSLQTLGLLPHPELHGRTGAYGPRHQERLAAILRLQDAGYSLQSLTLLFRALRDGQTLAAVLGEPEADTKTVDRVQAAAEAAPDSAELYGFPDLQPDGGAMRRGGPPPLLSLVPTTVWDESQAS
jgi:DNA-binding transcriptional MerR regulator